MVDREEPHRLRSAEIELEGKVKTFHEGASSIDEEDVRTSIQYLLTQLSRAARRPSGTQEYEWLLDATERWRNLLRVEFADRGVESIASRPYTETAASRSTVVDPLLAMMEDLTDVVLEAMSRGNERSARISSDLIDFLEGVQLGMVQLLRLGIRSRFVEPKFGEALVQTVGYSMGRARDFGTTLWREVESSGQEGRQVIQNVARVNRSAVESIAESVRALPSSRARASNGTQHARRRAKAVSG